MLLPGPSTIAQFSPLSNSVKSTLSGDTVQIPNVSAYFSNNYRDIAIPFYRNEYQKLTAFGFPALRLNYPPEFAYTAIKDQTESTYLEEFVYPLRDSLFVNGFEPFEKDRTPRFRTANFFILDEGIFETKVTLRYYPSSYIVRIITWIGICTSIYLLWRMGKRVILNA